MPFWNFIKKYNLHYIIIILLAIYKGINQSYQNNISGLVTLAVLVIMVMIYKLLLRLFSISPKTDNALATGCMFLVLYIAIAGTVDIETVVLAIMLTICSRFIHPYNHKEPINDQNIAKKIKYIGLILLVIMCYVAYLVIRYMILEIP